MWSGGDTKTSSMAAGTVEGEALMPALLNGQWVKQDASSLEHKPEPNENSQRNGLYSEVHPLQGFWSWIRDLEPQGIN